MGSGDLSSHFNLLPWHMARDEYGRLQRTGVQTPAKWTPTENSTMQPKENTILVRYIMSLRPLIVEYPSGIFSGKVGILSQPGGGVDQGYLFI